MQFSILIANYNNGRFFKDCYNSIMAQTHSDWEVIIIDDGSADDSVALIQAIVREDKRFKLYTDIKNNGCGYAKRKCIELANGEIAGFLDPDDALLPDALERMIGGFSSNPDAVLIHSSLIYCNEKLQETKNIHKASGTKGRGLDFFNLDYSVTAFAGFKINAYNKTEGLNPLLKRAVDQDLYLKMFEVGSFFFIDKELYLYRRHAGNISGGENLERSQFWHWYVIMQAANRRKIDVEELFLQFFVNRKKLEHLQKKIYNNRFYKIYQIFKK